VKGRAWLVAGALLGIAIGLGHAPFLAGAARSLADTAQHLVSDGGNRLISATASSGAPRRVVLALSAVVGVLLPGVASLLLVVAARGTLRVRAAVGLAVVALGAAAYFYQPKGVATGEIVLALVVAGLAVTLSGPLVAAPLTALAALIATGLLAQVVSGRASPATSNVEALHEAIFGDPGTPELLRLLLLVVALVPLVVAGRLLLRS
jgi:hypothetical protein